MRCYDTCCRGEPDIEYRELSRRPVKASRKPHPCAECGREIPAGSPCLAIAALVDGDFWTEYRHATGDPACLGGWE